MDGYKKRRRLDKGRDEPAASSYQYSPTAVFDLSVWFEKFSDPTYVLQLFEEQAWAQLKPLFDENSTVSKSELQTAPMLTNELASYQGFYGYGPKADKVKVQLAWFLIANPTELLESLKDSNRDIVLTEKAFGNLQVQIRPGCDYLFGGEQRKHS